MIMPARVTLMLDVPASECTGARRLHALRYRGGAGIGGGVAGRRRKGSHGQRARRPAAARRLPRVAPGLQLEGLLRQLPGAPRLKSRRSGRLILIRGTRENEGKDKWI